MLILLLDTITEFTAPVFTVGYYRDDIIINNK